MMRPRKMKNIELTVLDRDVDRVIEYLGKKCLMHFSHPDEAIVAEKDIGENLTKALDRLEKIRSAADFLHITLPEEPGDAGNLPSDEDSTKLDENLGKIAQLRTREANAIAERRNIEEAYIEARSFAKLDAPFADLEKLSYLTLRVGRLDPKQREALERSLQDRGMILSLGEDRVLAAASRKGRFALDTELQKAGFSPLTIPKEFQGVPADVLVGLENRLAQADSALALLVSEKVTAARELEPHLCRSAESWLMLVTVERLKAGLEATKSAFRLVGWVATESVPALARELERLTEGRVAIRSYDPQEIASVREGKEKIPVSLDHGRFVGGFSGLVFSYGAPLYGTIDPTPFVAISFTILFGIMFGDVGQGFVLLLLGLITSRSRVKFLSQFSRFSSALVAVGIASMTVGFLDGEVFATEKLLIRPTRAITGFLLGPGNSMDRILHLMPEKGSLDKLFFFFAFTVAVGVVINSIGLIINIINQFYLKHHEKAIFAKTGLAGGVLFWYALSYAVRFALGALGIISGEPVGLAWFDILGFGLPILGLFFGPALWRLLAGERPILEHGMMAFLMEGFVEILESASYFISNTVSFLRVGAFALSHAVLSFIVFALSDMVSGSAPIGAVFGFLVMVFGNSLIILLEGLIVTIQVIRLQYYEFFSKFFTETGVEFTPFRFRREVR